MKTIQTILDEFDNQFGTTLWANRRGDDEDAKDFISTAFDEYKKGLREAVMKLKIEHPTICKVWDDENIHCTCDCSPETWNESLAHVLKLVK